jgi:hypothetical protein
VKYVTITAPEKMDESIVFLVRPRTTTADILKALKLLSFVLFPLFPLSHRPRLLDQNDKLYEQISNGDCLLALSDSEAKEFYRLYLLSTVQELAGFLIRRARASRGVLADN